MSDIPRFTWVWPKLAKNQWGPRGWAWLHNTSTKYPDSPQPHEAQFTFRRIWGFLTSLPCIECREHAIAYATEHPLNMTSSHTLQIWSWNFHNSVNTRIGKPVMSLAEYRKVY